MSLEYTPVLLRRAGGGKPMPTAIEISGLTKKYLQRGEVVAVDNLSLAVEEGEVFGFLGPNGSGKTTTIKILLGLIFPDAGTCSLLGMPLARVETKKYIGFLPDSPYFYNYLTGEEFLGFYGQLFGFTYRQRQKK